MTNLSERSREPNQGEMESLFVNNPEFESIKAYLKRFNPIRTMKIERMEIRHSAILAWLLDPNETHGLGDRFLKAFLAEAFRGRSDMGKPTAVDISQADLRDAEVRREWQSIDIFILSQANNWAFIIENKFYSQQGDGQLARYKEKVQRIFKEQNRQLDVRGIFLTLQDEVPADEGYAPIRYRVICNLLSCLIKQNVDQLSPEVITFLKHYLDVIKDATGMSETLTEMAQLARQLYKRHKKVLDFVIEHGAGSDFAIAARGLFGEDPDRFQKIKVGESEFVFSSLTNSLVSFLPLSWYEKLGGSEYTWPGCENWWAGFPLIAWLQLWKAEEGAKGTLWLYAEVGPLASHDSRKALIEQVQTIGAEGNLKIGFQKGATSDGKRYSKLLKGNGRQIEDVHDAELLENGMRKLLNDFHAEFDAVAALLPGFVQYGMRSRGG